MTRRRDATGDVIDFLAKGGEMGGRMRRLDWDRTPLGNPRAWPQSLKTIVRVMLDSRYAMWMAWGPELTFFCNDAYLPTVGIKRDWVLGARSQDVWQEIWPDIGPRIEHVLTSGEATWDEGLLLFLERSGFPEETYHTFSYSPVYDDDNRVAGMLCVVTEVTERVIGERRLRLLRDLATRLVGVEGVDNSCGRVAEVLKNNPFDLPFAAIYLVGAGRSEARLTASTLEPGQSGTPPQLSRDSNVPWPVADALRDDRPQHLKDLPAKGVSIAAQPWPELIQEAMVLPLAGSTQTEPAGCIVIGLNPRRAFDEAYASFVDLIVGQVSAAIADAQNHEAERARAAALAEIDRAKTTFFSNVSHEFRTPLTLMLGPIEDTLAQPGISAASSERLEVARRNALRLLKLVNSLLDFSRIEAGRAQAAFEPTALAAFTRDLASTFRSAIERAGLGYTVECIDLDEMAYVDRDMWEKIVLNLLSNAFKFTLTGEIGVFLRRDGSDAVLEVRDTGVGVPPDEVPRLFERFHRVQSTEGRSHEGSGIGLAMVHELVKLHGGTIRVNSVLSQGTRFIVRIPLGTGHVPPDQVYPQRTRNDPSRASSFVQEALRWLEPASAHGPEVPMLRSTDGTEIADRRFASTFGSRIVLADDNSDMRAYLRDLLAPYYGVEAVGDGEMALAAARREIPDLLLSDVMMPRLDGFALLREVRADATLRSVPVLLLSARAGEEARIDGLDAGADDYLVKPFAARELLARVGALLELRKMRQSGDERYRAIVDQALTGICEIDGDGRFTTVNDRLCAILGYTPEELRAMTVPQITHPDDLPRHTEMLTRLLSGGPAYEIEKRCIRRDGSVVWVHNSISPLRDTRGRVKSVIGMVIDITERRTAAEELRAANMRREAMLSAAEIGSWIYDLHTHAVTMDANFARIFGFEAGEGSADAEHFDRVHPDDLGTIMAAIDTAKRTGRFYVREFRVVLPDGAIRWLAGRGTVQFNASDAKLMMGMVIDISDLKAMQEALRRSDRRKDEFLAMLAHELRNPLAPIQNATEILLRALPPEGKTREIAAIVKRQTGHLTRLVDDLLDVSRINEGRIELQQDILDLAGVIQQAIETVQPLLREKNHVLTWDPGGEAVFVRGDRVRLVQCVTNILANAAKYTNAGGAVSVRLSGSGSTASIAISDNGAGVSAELLPQIFDLFVQGDRTLDRSQGGLGIGLSVVKKLVEMHGGQVAAMSAGVDAGSTFEIRLPRADVQRVSGDVAAAGADLRMPPATRVLVVDDNVDAADSLAEILKLDGHEAKGVYNGKAALDSLKSFQPNVILLDLGLPMIDGYEVARCIRTLGQPVFLVALTGYGREDDKRRTTAAGFDAHLVKPLDYGVLDKLLRHYWQSRPQH